MWPTRCQQAEQVLADHGFASSTAHPFWAYGFTDVSIVHNGQITNYFKLKRKLEQRATMSYGALSKATKTSMGLACGMVGTSTNTGEWGMLAEERAAGKDYNFRRRAS